MIADRGERARLLKRHGFNLRRYLYLRTDELLKLVDKVHGGDVTFEFKADGIGIGLSVSRSIIENHHGRLWANSNDGPGVTFWFSIPSGAKDSRAENSSWCITSSF
jgi:signal transduction histidine kinase